jgi:hypothetical protein
MYKAKFKTAYDQREIVLDAKVTDELVVGALVTVTFGTPNVVAEAASVAAATHIVAQSDMTMEYGHVPVENRDYRYSDVVATSDKEKKVALFHISDKNDLITHEV